MRQSRAQQPAALSVLQTIVAFALALAVTATAHAATNSWKNATSGKWETSSNWSLNHAPSSSDDSEYITNAATKTVTIDATTTNSTNTLTISGLYVGGSASTSNTLFLDNAGTSTPLQVMGGRTFTFDSNAALVVNNSSIVGTNLNPTLYIGNASGHSHLTISNAGAVYCDNAVMGGTNDTATVSGTGSVWTIQGDLTVGIISTGCTLTVANGGAVQLGLNNGVSSVGNGIGSGNAVTVTDPGSIWNAGEELLFGYEGSSSTLTITNGGKVVCAICEVGGTFFGNSNSVTVTGAGSVFSNSLYNGGSGFLYIGYEGAVTTLTIANGGAVFSGLGGMGQFATSSNNIVTVTGPGSAWTLTSFNIGGAGVGNKLTITNGGMVIASNLVVGSSTTISSNNTLTIAGGSLFATSPGGTGTLLISPNGYKNNLVINSGSVTVDNLVATNGASNVISFNGGTLTVDTAFIANSQPFVIGGTNTSANYVSGVATQSFNNNLVVQRGTLTINTGVITANQLILTNGVNGVVALGGGELMSGGTFVTNGQQFVVGNGVSGANFHLLGGVHSFHDGLHIRNAATLTGCGTVNGSVTIDSGGSVFTDCGALTFTGTVTNNGAMAANNWSVLESSGTLVNNGYILLYNGGTNNFHGTFINNGVVLNAGWLFATDYGFVGDDVVIQIPSATGFTYQLEFTPDLQPPTWTDSGAPQSGTGGILTFTDPGGATNKPNRFYSIDVRAP